MLCPVVKEVRQYQGVEKRCERMAEQGAKGRKSEVYIKSIASRSRILVLAQRNHAERITIDLAVAFWQPSQMASRFISSFSTS
jgi:hypothetical protein